MRRGERTFLKVFFLNDSHGALHALTDLLGLLELLVVLAMDVSCCSEGTS